MGRSTVDLNRPGSFSLGPEDKELGRGAGFSGLVRARATSEDQRAGVSGSGGVGVPGSLCCGKPGALGLWGEGSGRLCVDGGGGLRTPGMAGAPGPRKGRVQEGSVG